MHNVIAAVLVGAFFIAATLWKIRADRWRGSPGRDDTLRAGGPTRMSQARASRRALGATAWTRISGP